MHLSSIQESIQSLIDVLHKTTNHQEEFRLIAKHLTNISKALGIQETANDELTMMRVLPNLEITVKTVRMCVNEDEMSDNFPTSAVQKIKTDQRQVQNVLLNAVGRLSSNEADLTKDPELKRKLLAQGFFEQQMLRQKLFDVQIKLRAEAAKADVIKNSQRLREELHQEHGHIIKAYLKQCFLLHSAIPVTGLEASVVSEVARRFYQISPAQQGALEQSWRSFQMPLTHCSIQLRADQSTSFERKAARQMLVGDKLDPFVDFEKTVEQRGTWTNRLINAPYMPSMVKRDRFVLDGGDKSFEIREVLRENRWLVILGDPGSGKTTFVRWLLLQCTQALRDGENKLGIDLGFVRMPILIRVGEFADALRDDSTLTLFSYIGQHKWFGNSILPHGKMATSDTQELSRALQDYVKKGQALIILDGLDEIPASEQRSRLVNLIESFVDQHIQTPSFRSVFDDPHVSNLIETPAESGGNQLLITSRIVGYHAAPMSGQFTHFIIKPMDVDHMKRFVDFWFRNVHNEILHILVSLDTEIEIETDMSETHANMLKIELDNEENIGLRELASNTFLMTFICIIAFGSEEMSLPTQRILLYSQTVNSMLSAWDSRGSGINGSKLVWILGDIAVHIHENSSSGLIVEEDLKNICSSSIRSYENIQSATNGDLKRFGDEAVEFVQIIRDDVGILAARGESMYGFLHLTFQEYFASLSLSDKKKLRRKPNPLELTDIQLIARSLHDHIGNPRFHIVLTLAFGKLSLSRVHDFFDKVCSAFLMQSRELDSFLPLGPLLLISCGNDLNQLPSSNILLDALDQLLVAAGRDHWYSTSPKLFTQLVDSMKKLPDSSVTKWIHRILSRASLQTAETIRALCRLIQCGSEDSVNADWLDPSICQLLLNLSYVNKERNDFSTDTLLAKIVERDHRLLPAPSGGLRFFLEQKEVEISSIHPSIIAILIALYGGLKRCDKTVVFDSKHIYQDSLLLTPLLIDYFADQRLPQIEKLHRFEEKCHQILSTSSLSDESCDVVDAMMAILCISGIDKLCTHPHLLKSKIFLCALAKLKHVSFILRQCYSSSNSESHARQILSEYMKTNGLLDRSCANKSGASDFFQLVQSVTKAMARLSSAHTLHLPDSLKTKELLQCLLSPDITLSSTQQSCSHLSEFVSLFWILEDDEETDTQYRIAVAADTIPSFLLYNNDKDPLYILAFVPEYLRPLFICLLKQHDIVQADGQVSPNSLPFQHILIECLMILSNSTSKGLSLGFSLRALLSSLCVYKLENLAASLLWEFFSTEDDDMLQLFDYTRQQALNIDIKQQIDDPTELFCVPNDFARLTRKELISCSLQQEQTRLQDARAMVEQSSRDEKANVNLYSASVSLAYICWFSDDVDSTALLSEALTAATSIQLPLVQFDALCAISLHPRIQPDLVLLDNKQSLRDELEKHLVKTCANLTPLLHSAVMIRCFPVLQKTHAMNVCVKDLLDKLDSKDTCMSLSDREAIYVALFEISYGNQLIYSHLQKRMETTSETGALKSKSFLPLRSSVFLSYFGQNSESNRSPSMVSLLSAMYLTELTSDCSRLSTWFALNFTQNSGDLLLDEKEKILNMNGTVILTYTQAQSIENLFQFYVSQEQGTKALINLSESLHSLVSVESTAWPIIAQWLAFEYHPALQRFSWHAALLFIQSNRWTAKATMIVCDLLCSEHDRYRQRADEIMGIHDDKQVKTRSQLGLVAVIALYNRYAWSCHNSACAEIALRRKIFHTSIDQVHHLETILQLEQYRIMKLNYQEQVNNNIEHKELSGILRVAIASNYLDVSLCVTLERLSPELFLHMANLLKSDFSTLPQIHTASQQVSDNDHQIFVVNVLVSLGITLINENIDGTILVDAIVELVQKTSSNKVQQAAVYALGFSKFGANPLSNIIQSAAKHSIEKEFQYPEEVVCTAIRAYCYGASYFPDDYENEENMNAVFQLLEHSSPNVVKATRQSLRYAIGDIDRLLELLKSDHVECYRALLTSTADIFISSESQTRIESAACFITEHPDLLPIFVFDLYDNIRHFSDEIFHDGSALYKYEYEYPHYVAVAALLAELTPAAFCTCVNECDYGNDLKHALYYTSKQRRTVRRAACLTVLSAFGDLTADLCEMLVQALLDDPHVQNTCYRSLGRIQSVKNEQAISKLLNYLNSDSMNTRYVASKLLIRLVQSTIIPLVKVQEALTRVINDPTSNEALWLIEEQEDVMAKSSYYNAGKLKDAVYNLLVTHLVSDVSSEAASNTMASTSAGLTEEDIDFIASEKLARLAACLFHNEAEQEQEKEETDNESICNDLNSDQNRTDNSDSRLSDVIQDVVPKWELVSNNSAEDDRILNANSSNEHCARNDEDSRSRERQTPAKRDDRHDIGNKDMVTEPSVTTLPFKETVTNSPVTNKNELTANKSTCCVLL